MRDAFARADPCDDAHFYAVERKVVHLEPGAIAALRDRYAALLPPGAPILHLMSSSAGFAERVPSSDDPLFLVRGSVGRTAR